MKKITVLIAIISILSVFLVTDSSARSGMKWKGSGDWGMGSQYSNMYDPKTVETIKGDVVRVDKVTPMKGMSYGVHLTVKTEGETVSVHLGPGWYIENQDIKIEPKDSVEIKGSRISFEDKPTPIAAEVKKGVETLKLRDENRIPAWSSWRRP